MKFSHERKVRSLAKKTFGSTRVGRAMRLPMRGVSWLVSVELGATKTIKRAGMKLGDRNNHAAV